jgi:hypothetical protein
MCCGRESCERGINLICLHREACAQDAGIEDVVPNWVSVCEVFKPTYQSICFCELTLS